ncbi:Hypp5410 [Branchiostoma lanceolatum]|uniref:Hypp5410 protein n=1 Tax=Branchiostoma lanceolatum TaxID=7740 RepID=A0A8K0AIJ2_BRALA|nr:Hypp5410 [Branchiostoma lanceolatum]
MQELRLEDEGSFYNYLRMEPNIFDELLQRPKDHQLIQNAEEVCHQDLVDGTINLPDPDPLPNDDCDTPYFILWNDAFALRTYMMKPYSLRGLTKQHRIYNYRISRGRRVVENTFCILAQRFQVLLTTMQQYPKVVQDVLEACICLHNLMRDRYPALQNDALDNEDDDHNLLSGEWRETANMHEIE